MHTLLRLHAAFLLLAVAVSPLRGADAAKATPEALEQALRVLGDYQRDHLEAMTVGGDEGEWSQRRKAWESRCAALSGAAIACLGYAAAAWPEEGYRAAACDALAKTGRKGVDMLLVQSLKDTSPRVRRAAAGRLGDRRSVGAVRHLLPLLATDPDAGVRTAAGFALGHIGSDQATQGLVRALREDGDERVKEAALSALAWIADPAALPALREALNAADGKTKQVVQNAIRNIEDPDFWELGAKRGVTVLTRT